MQDRLLSSLRIAIFTVLALWLIHLLNWVLGYELNRFGIWPRELQGLAGIALAPLLHMGFSHLLANSVPLFVALAGLLLVHPRSSPAVIAGIWLGSGLLLWLFGRGLIHVGASGLIYGLLSFAFFIGVFRRRLQDVVLAVLIFVLYGSLIWGIVPAAGPISWEGHLAGALVGGGLAWRFRRRTLS